VKLVLPIFFSGNVVASGYQCDGAVVFAPRKQLTNLQLTLFLQKIGGVCGDGATMRVSKGVFDTTSPSQSLASFTTVYEFLFRNSTSYEVNVGGVTSLAANEALVFRLDQQTSPDCDVMSFRLWATADIVYDDITPFTFTVAEANNVVLPPNGYVAWNTGLDYLSYSGKLASDTIAVDYSSSEFSTFARSRSGLEQTIEDVKTDGTVAFEPSEEGDNHHLYFAALKTASKDSKLFLESDTQIYGRVVYLNASSLEITVYATAQQTVPPRVSLFYGGFSDALLSYFSYAEEVVVTYETTGTALGTHAVVAINAARAGLDISMTSGQTVIISVDVSNVPIAPPVHQPVAVPQSEPVSEPISEPAAEPSAPTGSPLAQPNAPIAAPVDVPASAPIDEEAPSSSPVVSETPSDGNVPVRQPEMSPQMVNTGTLFVALPVWALLANLILTHW
jgi:hypothetical protein